jgi:hypothetical protein
MILSQATLARRKYEYLISTVPRESNMTRVYVNACVQVHMRGVRSGSEI